MKRSRKEKSEASKQAIDTTLRACLIAKDAAFNEDPGGRSPEIRIRVRGRFVIASRLGAEQPPGVLLGADRAGKQENKCDQDFHGAAFMAVVELKSCFR